MILIVVDTLRADHLGTYGYERSTSPEIDRWAQEGAVFERALATSSWTLPTFGSILSGQLPARHKAGVRMGETWIPTGLREGVETITEKLAAAGVETGAVVNNWFLSEEFGLAQGFMDYDFADKRRADEAVDRALAWIGRRRGSRFFLLLHLMDPHVPYDAPPPMAGRFATGLFEQDLPSVKKIRQQPEQLSMAERDELVSLYDEELSFVDAELGRFLEGLGKLWEETLVILTSDHGEEFFEHGGFEHGHALYQEVLRAPLIVWGPGIEPGRTGHPVSLTDLAPTILEAVGLDPGEETRGGTQDNSGRSLWRGLQGGELDRGRTLFAEGTLHGAERRAIVKWPFKLIWSAEETDSGDRQVELFDLANDPGETKNLGLDNPDVQQQLSGLLEERWRRTEAEAGSEPAVTEADEEMLERLRALGYLD